MSTLVAEPENREQVHTCLEESVNSSRIRLYWKYIVCNLLLLRWQITLCAVQYPGYCDLFTRRALTRSCMFRVRISDSRDFYTRNELFFERMFALVVLISLFSLSAALFAGKYSDPNHPNCARVISLETKVSAKVFGADAAAGEGAPCDGVTDIKWGPLPAVIDGVSIKVDFSSKGGPTDLSGKYANDAINWEDGNAWKKLTSKD